MIKIVIVIASLFLTILGLFLIIREIETIYQSPIAVAFVTVIIQLTLFLLKQELDKNSHKKPKTFGVVYDQKFSAYNTIYCNLIDARSWLIEYYNNDECDSQTALDKVEIIRKNILYNHLFIQDELYLMIDNYFKELKNIYFFRFENNISDESSLRRILLSKEYKQLLNENYHKEVYNKIRSKMKIELDID